MVGNGKLMMNDDVFFDDLELHPSIEELIEVAGLDSDSVRKSEKAKKLQKHIDHCDTCNQFFKDVMMAYVMYVNPSMDLVWKCISKPPVKYGRKELTLLLHPSEESMAALAESDVEKIDYPFTEKEVKQIRDHLKFCVLCNSYYKEFIEWFNITVNESDVDIVCNVKQKKPTFFGIEKVEPDEGVGWLVEVAKQDGIKKVLGPMVKYKNLGLRKIAKEVLLQISHPDAEYLIKKLNKYDV